MAKKFDLGAGWTAQPHGVGLTIRGPLEGQVFDLDAAQVDKLRAIMAEDTRGNA